MGEGEGDCGYGCVVLPTWTGRHWAARLSFVRLGSRIARGGGQEVAPLDAIELRGVSHGFTVNGERLAVLDGIDLRVSHREIVAVVGPNGCGKSTLLRVISGLLRADAGEVSALGATVDGVDARIGLVFQEPRLLPWRSVLANVALPLELAGIDVVERTQRASAALELTGLPDFAEAMPHQLSGGMAQRAALARALLPEPTVLLLDEPFSALDAMTRERLDAELLNLWDRTGTTIVLVTHSISEAVFLADRVVVMSARPGHIVAEVRVEVERPRSLSGHDGAAFSAAAERVRAALGSEATGTLAGTEAA